MCGLLVLFKRLYHSFIVVLLSTQLAAAVESPKTKAEVVSPETKVKRFFSPIRRQIVTEKHNNDGKIHSDVIRKLHSKDILETYYTENIVCGKVVYQRDDRIDPQAIVLSKNGIWETNLDRMKRGLCPIADKGIHKSGENLTNNQIRKKQKQYRIELQHVTQKDTGLADDPILEMSHVDHMGKNARIVWRMNPDSGDFEIIASSLSKEEAQKYVEEDTDCSIDTNILHFRHGKSLINRIKFATWRKDYWKARAKDFEQNAAKSVARVLNFDH